MTPFPWHNFELRTRLTPQQVREALTAHLEEEKWFRMTMPNRANDKRFTGRADTASFSIHRILGYRNSFAPMTSGTIATDGRESRIDVKMRLHPVVIVFLVAWLAIMGTAFIGIAVASSPYFAPIALLALGVIYALTLFAFWYEVNKQETALREIFQAS